MASEQTEKPNLDKADKTDKVFHFVIALLKHSKTGKVGCSLLPPSLSVLTMSQPADRLEQACGSGGYRYC